MNLVCVCCATLSDAQSPPNFPHSQFFSRLANPHFYWFFHRCASVSQALTQSPERFNVHGLNNLRGETSCLRSAKGEVQGEVQSAYLTERKENILVGAPRFELGTSCAQGRRATRLRYAPTVLNIHSNVLSKFASTSPRAATSRWPGSCPGIRRRWLFPRSPASIVSRAPGMCTLQTRHRREHTRSWLRRSPA